jgi:agmatinase
MTTPLPSGFDADAAGDASAGIFGLPTLPEDARVVIIPVPYEATVSYGDGTANGPAAILAASRQVDLFDAQVGKPYERGIAMLDIPDEIRKWSDDGRKAAAQLLARGGASNPECLLLAKTVDALSTGMNLWVRKRVREQLDAGRIAIVVGGDHSVPFGAFEAYAAKYPGLGILHFDAHYDLRVAYGGFTWSHASIMYNALARIPAIRSPASAAAASST